MKERRKGHIGRWHLLAMLVMVLLLGMSAGSAFAGRLTDTAAGLPKAAPPGSSSGVAAAPSSKADAPTIPDPKSSSSAPAAPQGNAYMTLDPSISTFGNYCAVDCLGSTGCP